MVKVRERTFLVLGLGTFGAETARALYRGGAIVLAVDHNERIVEEISPFVTDAVCADATNEQVLSSIGAFDLDVAIVAIRRHFDTTVLATHMLKQQNFEELVVQVANEKEGSAVEAIGATTVIFPERDMADRIARKLLVPDLADQIPLEANFAVIDVPCPAEFVGKSLKDLDIRRNHRVTIVAIKTPRAGKADEYNFQIAPPPDAPLEAVEHLVVLGDVKHLARFKEWTERSK